MGAVFASLAREGFFANGDEEIDGAISDSMKARYDAMRIPDNDRVWSLTQKQLGTNETLYLKLKDGKAKTLLPFVVYLLAQGGGGRGPAEHIC